MKPTNERPQSGVTEVLVRCVSCHAKRVVRAGEITNRYDVPMCLDCYSPMVAVEARGR